jgi:hypothetical protein
MTDILNYRWMTIKIISATAHFKGSINLELSRSALFADIGRWAEGWRATPRIALTGGIGDRLESEGGCI